MMLTCINILCLIIIILCQYDYYSCTIEKFETDKTASCLLCKHPKKIWLDFLSSFKSYDVYVVVDDDSDISEFKQSYPKITFVQISDNECRKEGYINMNFTIKKECSAWEKGIYYFTKKQNYSNVWFFEDDVFFRNEMDLLNIDKQYPSQDLLSAPHAKAVAGTWHWSVIHVSHAEPHYAAMCCAIRVSRTLLKQLERVAKKHKTLYFLEAMFPTESHDLTYAEPNELKTITYNDKHTTYIPGNIYHPLKDIDMHKRIRNE
jgi:hypothetical protein